MGARRRRTIGFAIGFGLLLIAKYVALRWAVGPFLPLRAAWLVAIAGTVLLPWSAAWRMRYSAGELSAIFLFLALGWVLRTRGRLRLVPVVDAAVAVGLMLATYQALALCACALPAVALAGLPSPPVPRADAVRVWARRVVLAWAPIALGGVLYGIYSLIAVKLVGSAGYEGVLNDSQTNMLTPSGVIDALPTMYRTAYSRLPWTLPLLGALLRS